MNTYKKLSLYLLLCVGMVTFCRICPLHAQNNFDYYHPPYASHKWTTIEIKCYVVSYIPQGQNNDLAFEVFSKAAAAWNRLFQEIGIQRTITILHAAPQDIVGKPLLYKNVCGISNNILTGEIANNPGGTREVENQPSTTIDGQLFNLNPFHHVELNLQLLKDSILRQGRGNRTTGIYNIYLIAVHELGHLLGMSGSHDVPPPSIMMPGQTRYSWDAAIENYDGTGDIPPLSAIDKKLMKAIYGKASLDCLPYR